MLAQLCFVTGLTRFSLLLLPIVCEERWCGCSINCKGIYTGKNCKIRKDLVVAELRSINDEMQSCRHISIESRKLKDTEVKLKVV